MFLFRDDEGDERPQLVIVPMVDVMLFLLAFFVLIAGSAIPGLAVKTNPPETVQKASFKPKEKVVTVVVKKDGAVYYGNKKLTFDELVRLLKSFKKKDGLISLVIDADREASVQALVKVMDAASKAGINSIGLLAKEKNERGS